MIHLVKTQIVQRFPRWDVQSLYIDAEMQCQNIPTILRICPWYFLHVFDIRMAQRIIICHTNMEIDAKGYD